MGGPFGADEWHVQRRHRALARLERRWRDLDDADQPARAGDLPQRSRNGRGNRGLRAGATGRLWWRCRTEHNGRRGSAACQPDEEITMSNAFIDAADTIRRLAKHYEGMQTAANLLDQLGSLEQAKIEAKAAVE